MISLGYFRCRNINYRLFCQKIKRFCPRYDYPPDSKVAGGSLGSVMLGHQHDTGAHHEDWPELLQEIFLLGFREEL